MKKDINNLLQEAMQPGNAEKYNKISNYLYKNFDIKGAEINLLILHMINNIDNIL